MYILLTAYLFLNGITVGHFASDADTPKCFNDFIRLFLGVLLFTSLGVTIWAIAVWWSLILAFWNWINRTFQIKFLVGFYFFGKYKEIPEENLYRFNCTAKRRTSNSISDRIYRFCIKIANERNNYVFTPKNDN